MLFARIATRTALLCAMCACVEAPSAPAVAQDALCPAPSVNQLPPAGWTVLFQDDVAKGATVLDWHQQCGEGFTTSCTVPFAVPEQLPRVQNCSALEYLNQLSRFWELETPPPPCGRRLQANRNPPKIMQPYLASVGDDAGTCSIGCAANCKQCPRPDCEDCPGCTTAGCRKPGCCQSSASQVIVKPGETAEVILEIMEMVGPSVLKGTDFEQPEPRCISSPCCQQQNSDDRGLFVKWIRKLDAQRQQSRPASEPLVVWQPVKIQRPPAEQIEALRHVSRQLDESAGVLEERNLYDWADKLREVADQLRRQARGQQPPALPHQQHPTPQHDGTTQPPDLERQVDALREELHRTREALGLPTHLHRR